MSRRQRKQIGGITQTINQSVNQTWHAPHAINVGTACDLSTAGCPVDQVLDLTAPTGATSNQSINQSINKAGNQAINQSTQTKSSYGRHK